MIFRIATLRCIFARDGESKWKSRLLESGLKHMGRSRKRRSSMAIPKTDRPPGRTEALARTDVQSLKGTFSIAEALVWITLAVLCAFSLGTLVYPMVRAFYRFPINYNEGWNVYTTQVAMQHLPLYYPKYGWTTVNYPFLSFYLVGYVSRFIGGYLLTGRLLSLVALLVSCVLVGLIVKKLTDAWGPAIFAGAFCLGLFCSQISSYVAMDDPQMLAHPFFLFGLWLYLAAPPSTMRIAGITSLFALGGNIKQNLLPAPISVFLDLFLTSSSKAVRFMVFGVFLLALSIAVNMWIGGPFFISHLLTSRAYTFMKLRNTFAFVFSSLGQPLLISAFWSIWQLGNRQGRVISFYFFSSLLIGLAFGGGAGVSENTFFDNVFAMSIIMGACLDLLWKAPISSFGKGGRWRFLVPVLLYLNVVSAFGLWRFKVPDPVSELPGRESVYMADVSFLARKPGPAICETLMLCYDAGKPYILDPFNSTRLVQLGKLDSHEIVKQIAEKKYGAIQTETPATQKPSRRFPDDVLDAIDRYYVEALKGPDCYIYFPRGEPVKNSDQ